MIFGYDNSYASVDLTSIVRQKLTHGGTFTLAVHRHQITGGQRIDVGNVENAHPKAR